MASTSLRCDLVLEQTLGHITHTKNLQRLLPGVTDLRRNRSDEGTVVTFTTGVTEPFGLYVANAAHWSGLGAGAVLALLAGRRAP